MNSSSCYLKLAFSFVHWMISYCFYSRSLFQNFLLFFIIKISLSSWMFSPVFKHTVLSPIFKIKFSLYTISLSSYYLISMIPFATKFLKTVVFRYCINAVSSFSLEIMLVFHLHHPMEFHCATETTLVKIANDVHVGISNNQFSILTVTYNPSYHTIYHSSQNISESEKGFCWQLFLYNRHKLGLSWERRGILSPYLSAVWGRVENFVLETS